MFIQLSANSLCLNGDAYISQEVVLKGVIVELIACNQKHVQHLALLPVI